MLPSRQNLILDVSGKDSSPINIRHLRTSKNLSLLQISTAKNNIQISKKVSKAYLHDIFILQEETNIFLTAKKTKKR